MVAAVPDLWPGDMSVVFGEVRVRKLFRFATKTKTRQSLKFDLLIVPM
jgi:hypothetical protein